ncbi:MAG: hypothetical protein ACK559_25985, partial [bacterium]
LGPRREAVGQREAQGLAAGGLDHPLGHEGGPAGQGAVELAPAQHPVAEVADLHLARGDHDAARAHGPPRRGRPRGEAQQQRRPGGPAGPPSGHQRST